MATLETNLYLTKYLDPQLLIDRRNFRDDFLATLGTVPQGARTADGVRRNKLINNVEFKVNNTSNFTTKKVDGKSLLVPWEHFDTTPTSVTDEELRYLPFNKMSAIRKLHDDCFKSGIMKHSMYKLCPKDNTQPIDMPVLKTTGENDGTGRLRMTYADLVNFITLTKKWNLPIANQLYMILSPQHTADLLLDPNASKFFYDRSFYADPKSGKIRGFMGMQFFENNDTPFYNMTSLARVEESSSPSGSTDSQASIAYYASNTYYHIEGVKSLFKPMEMDTKSANPTAEYRQRTWGIVDKIEEFGVAAIVSGKNADAVGLRKE